MQHDHQTHDTSGRLGNVSRYVFVGFAAIALFFLITEHRAHLFGILPFLLLAACLLLHMFGHGGHSGHGGRGDGTQDRQDQDGASAKRPHHIDSGLR